LRTALPRLYTNAANAGNCIVGDAGLEIFLHF